MQDVYLYTKLAVPAQHIEITAQVEDNHSTNFHDDALGPLFEPSLEMKQLNDVINDIEKKRYELVSRFAIPLAELTTLEQTSQIAEQLGIVGDMTTLPNGIMEVKMDAEEWETLDKGAGVQVNTNGVGSSSSMNVAWSTNTPHIYTDGSSDQMNNKYIGIPALISSKNVHSNRLFNSIHEAVTAEGYFGVDWSHSWEREIVLSYIKDQIEKLAEQNLIRNHQYEVICDKRNNSSNELYQGNVTISIYYWQAHCMTKTELHYKV